MSSLLQTPSQDNKGALYTSHSYSGGGQMEFPNASTQTFGRTLHLLRQPHKGLCRLTSKHGSPCTRTTYFPGAGQGENGVQEATAESSQPLKLLLLFFLNIYKKYNFFFFLCKKKKEAATSLSKSFGSEFRPFLTFLIQLTTVSAMLLDK